MYVQLVGTQRNTGTSITYEVGVASFAVLGTDFTITTPSPLE